MALNVTITNDCKKIIVKVSEAVAGVNNLLKVHNGTTVWETSFPGGQASYSIVLYTDDIGISNGIIHVEHWAGGTLASHSAVVGVCDVLCCLAKRMDELLDCNCECSKCSSQLAAAQKIFLLIKAAEAELAAYTRGGDILQAEAAITNAEKKYLKAVELCGGHCGCNC